ncbi:MAG: hypothetical protein NTV06_04600 [candidate division Zixibacteria bacterium]|nr:hypothetical protein [candidate division Zixibacteria bacterium]
MYNKKMQTFTILILSLMLPLVSYGAKYAGEPFSLGVGARPLAMGGATIAGPFDGSAGYWNPAGLNHLNGRNFIVMHAETFGSLLNHDFAGYASKKGNAKNFIQAYGFYLYYLGGGGIKITDLNVHTERPFVVREESHADYLMAGSLSTRIRNIDLGLTGRLIYRNLPTISGYGLTADMGALYHPVNPIYLGLMITDALSGVIHYSNGTSESILPTVKPAILIQHTATDITGRLAVSGDIKFEGIRDAAQFWQGNISLDTHLGMELSYREMLFGRAGLDIGNFTAGIGINYSRITFDLAYLHNSYFDETFRISAGYQF